MKINNLGLGVKFLVAAAVMLMGVLAVNYVMFLRSYAHDAKEAMVAKAGAFTAVADAAKDHASVLATSGAYDREGLLAEVKKVRETGGDYRATKMFDSIPVVVGWKSAANAAKSARLLRAPPAMRGFAVEPNAPKSVAVIPSGVAMRCWKSWFHDCPAATSHTAPATCIDTPP